MSRKIIHRCDFPDCATLVEVSDDHAITYRLLNGTGGATPCGWTVIFTQGPHTDYNRSSCIQETTPLDRAYEVCPRHRDELIVSLVQDKRLISVHIITVPSKGI